MTRPALYGGEPVRKTFLPYARQTVTDEDIRAVETVLRSDRLTCGPAVDRFEQDVARLCGAAEAVAVSSGTAGLHAAVHAAGIRAGDEVITSPITFCSTANAVMFEGGIPVFADVREDIITLDAQAADAAVTSRTRAIIAVDYAGHPSVTPELKALAKRRGLVLIEDAAHALGAGRNGKRIGTDADMTVFSFHPVKHVACGEGGMVVTQSAASGEAMRIFRHSGIRRDESNPQRQSWYYEMQRLGNNYRLSDIACALGASQLQRLETNLARRQAIAERYAQGLSGIDGLRLPKVLSGYHSAWHLYPVRIEPAVFRASRDEVIRALAAEGIGANVHYIPVPHHPYYRSRFGDRDGRWPVAERAFSQLASLPMFHGMTDDDADSVIAAVRRLAAWYARANEGAVHV